MKLQDVFSSKNKVCVAASSSTKITKYVHLLYSRCWILCWPWMINRDLVVLFVLFASQVCMKFIHVLYIS